MNFLKIQEPPKTPKDKLKKFMEDTISQLSYLDTSSDNNIPNIEEIISNLKNLLNKAKFSITTTYYDNLEFHLLISNEDKHKKIVDRICWDLAETLDNNKKFNNKIVYLNENLCGLKYKEYIPLLIMWIIYTLHTDSRVEKIKLKNVPGKKKKKIISRIKNNKETIEKIINNALYSINKAKIPPRSTPNIKIKITAKKQTTENNRLIKNYFTITLTLKKMKIINIKK